MPMSLVLMRPKKKPGPTYSRAADLRERKAIYEAMPCVVKGCTNRRFNVSSLCVRHTERVREHGHPTLRLPPAASRKRWIAIVRPLVQQVLADGTSVAARELRGWHALVKEQALRWAVKLPYELQRKAAGRIADGDLEDLLVALVCFVASEQRMNFRDEDPRGYLSLWPKRLNYFYACSVRTWLASAGGMRGMIQSRQMRAANKVVAMVLAYRAPTTAMQLGLALHRKLATRFNEALAEQIRLDREQERLKIEAKLREMRPYGGANADGSVDLWRREPGTD